MNKHIKYIALVAFSLLAFIGCEDKNEFSNLLKNDLYNLKKETIKISADQKLLTFDAESHFAELQFEANFWWKLDTVLISAVDANVVPLEAHSWFSITPTDNFGNRSVTITLTRNIEKCDRKVLLKFLSEDGNQIKTLELIQEASVPFVEIKQNRMDFSLLTSVLTVELSTTENWSVEVPDWCTTLSSSGTKCKSNTISINVLKNDTKIDRKGIIKFTGGGITKEFEIVQGSTFEKPSNVIVINSDKLEVQWTRSTGAIAYKLNYYEPGTNNLIDTCTVTFAESYPETINFDISTITTWKGFIGNVDVTVSATLGQDLWEESTERIRMNTHFGDSETADGSISKPFLIKNQRHFFNIYKKLSASYSQEVDLDLSTKTNFVPINNFTGMYDGKNHAISNLTLSPTINTPYGIFGIITGVDAGVKNLKLVNCSMIVEQAVYPSEIGLLAGRLIDGTIENCEVRNYSFFSKKASTIGVGGLLGFNNRGKVLNCRMYSGVMSSAVMNATTGLIQSATNMPLGGIVGRNGASNSTDSESLIENCFNYDMKLIGGIGQVGGIVAQNNSTIRSTVNYATIRARQHIGGIAGGSTATDASASGSLIENCANWGEISVENAGGFAQVGGIIGRGLGTTYLVRTSTIRRCFNVGSITMKTQSGTSTPLILGGIAGRLLGYIVEDCYNVGNITSTVGGIQDAINGGVNLGGFAGNFEGGTLTNCYTTGTVTGSAFYNGLFAGLKTGNTTNIPANAISCFALLQTGVPMYAYVSATATGSDPVGLSDAEMKDPAKLEGFDFGTVWQISAGLNNGYPTLKGMNYTPPSLVRKRLK